MRALWLPWVLANAVAELIGLGSTAIVVLLLLGRLGTDAGLGPALLIASASVLSGTLVEGMVVGTAQWSVLRGPFPEIAWRRWTIATTIGAFIAWSLGIMPSALINSGQDPTAPAAGGVATEPSQAVIYALAFALGVGAGAILGVPQWLVLRACVRRASLWVLANMVAWALGMVVIFTGTSAIPDGGEVTPGLIALLALALLAAGATVGAVHGLALVRLAAWRRSALRPPVLPRPRDIHTEA